MQDLHQHPSYIRAFIELQKSELTKPFRRSTRRPHILFISSQVGVIDYFPPASFHCQSLNFQPTAMTEPIPLLNHRRVLTGHNHQGLGTVKSDSHITQAPVGDKTNLAVLWCTTEHPAGVNSTEDKALSNTSMPPKGSGLTAYDLAPQSEGVFARSRSTM